MSTPQAKRRRLNEATLRKPFKSPFRTPIKPTPPTVLGPDTPSRDPPDASNATPLPITKPGTTPIPSRALASTPRRLNLSTPSRSAVKKTSPSLAREIVQLRSEIQILTQAHALMTSSKDEDLAKLVDSWRTASRAAAEELFAGTRDRVNRMGGVGAWKEREKEQKEWRTKWEREEMDAERERALERLREEGGGGDEEPRDYNDYDSGAVPDAEAEGKQGDDRIDDESFTMDMMLKTLNIDLKLIGYDKQAQRWEG